MAENLQVDASFQDNFLWCEGTWLIGAELALIPDMVHI